LQVESEVQSNEAKEYCPKKWKEFSPAKYIQGYYSIIDRKIHP
jgi:hypothetical protein